MEPIDYSFLFNASINAFDNGDRSPGSVEAAYPDVAGDIKKTEEFLSSLRKAVKDSPRLHPEITAVALTVAQHQPDLVRNALCLVTDIVQSDPTQATPNLAKQIGQVRNRSKSGSR